MTIPASAMEEISPAKWASARPLRGRNASRSITRPSTAPKTNTIGSAAHRDNPPRSTSSMPTKAEAANTAGCARFSRSRMPKTSVKPIANNA